MVRGLNDYLTCLLQQKLCLVGLTIMEEGEFGGDKEIVMSSQIINIATDEERIPVAVTLTF